MNVHSEDDLVLISNCLKSTKSSFRVLCGCHALEKFLQEEKRVTILEENIKSGLMQMQKESSDLNDSMTDQNSLSNQD